MTEQHGDAENRGARGREPVFLIPGGVTGLIGVLVAIHLAQGLVLNQESQLQLVNLLAFLPLRIAAAAEDIGLALPLVWTPFTHALLHAGWEHLIVNVAWLAIFATPVARRYGTWPMLAIFFASAAAGAAAFALTDLMTVAYLIGASGGVAGLMGAAMRFIFQPVIVGQDPETGERVILGRRLASLSEMMRNPRARVFTLFWVLLNAAIPFLPLLTGQGVQIAWQSHLGGFVAGLLLVGLFERRPAGAQ
ncbi:rhomboid family intramembrane serine protease [Devosia nitrariae]|uniref:Rhomboid family intramembrane serine protease n=1 Tax=Devosia nitrariae TaxID=2071872 RepID=A0ABQ5WCY5_9HYPH|nr:rhomboid family intramembrane serine protease [Devosia nitrariae]GLQ57578.1 rhomboid family intramembrane serine protease [Devosia nitrariae]